MNEIVKILMVRDGMSREDAEGVLDMARLDLAERLVAGEIPDDICMEYFGIEADYIMDLL